MKLSDYVIGYLADYGVRHIFMLTGGGAMHLNDSIAKAKRIRYICNHHEQACAMAAEAYARVTGKIGVVNVTSGPGGINALNGVFGAWTDSVPMLVLSGQVKRETCMTFRNVPGLRQLGDQEADIISMVQGITKYAVCVGDPDSIRYHLERALYLAQSGRPGPCWLDIPIDVQSSQINVAALAAYDASEDAAANTVQTRTELTALCDGIIARIKESPRPVILAGTGIRCAGALDIFEKVISRLRIPVTTAWAHDVIASDHPLYCGRPGTIGERGGNFVVQNAHTLLILGSRLNIRQVSYNWKEFAPSAFKIQVDVDPAEFDKPTVIPDMSVPCDVRVFLEELDRRLDSVSYDADAHSNWLEWCKERMRLYPVVPARRTVDGPINPYEFVDTVFRRLTGDDVVVTANGAACIIPFQVACIKKGMRLISNSGSASMGYDVPAAVGAAVAGDGKRVICFAGDGSIQLNIQELQTLVHHRLPVKIFVLNNGGYLSIRSTQQTFFENFIGESPASGVSFPDMVKIAEAYGLKTMRTECRPFASVIDEALNAEGPVLCDVIVDPDQGFEPRMKSSALPDGTIVSPRLEDMFPFLDRAELEKNMLK
ncbi:MAG TPA: thiamine pyrophosphate-binding protein [Desulfomonilaceae bacterium]|nr:thiamine pyrophosphate-binding protein [Desulfomonilaceae bacterium]